MQNKQIYQEVVRLTRAGGYSQREIAAAAGCAPSTVHDIQKKIRDGGFDLDELKDMGEQELKGLLCARRGKKPDENYGQIDHAAIQAELERHPKLTLMIVWEEYASECADANKIPYKYSYFVQAHRDWQGASDLSLRLAHIAADRMEVDWAGDTMEWIDPFTGRVHKVYLFVACLPFSQYTFVKPTESMDMEEWIAANVGALHFFGGTPRIIIIDNLKTGVTKHTKDEIVINRTYQEFAAHYGVAVLPAPVRKPKAKASVESNVGKIGERIALMLRNRRFFSMAEIEKAVKEKLKALNARPFAKRRDGSREEVFLSKEKPRLAPLPPSDFECGRWLTRTVSADYRVQVDSSTYSVPYAFAGKSVEVRVGAHAVEVFSGGERIATHPKAKAKGEDIAQDSHRPTWHTEFLERSAERYIQRATDEIGPSARAVVKAMLSAGRVEEEGYRSCEGLLGLVKGNGKDAVESACKRALDIVGCPSLKTVRILLKTQAQRSGQRDARKDFALLRDEDYYSKATDSGEGVVM